jgi:Uma2 family endonuclease
MKSVLDLSLKQITLATINKKLILQGIGWDFYEELLEEYKDSNELHFAYDNGFLEVEMPLSKHEIPIQILTDLVKTICIELEIDIKSVGSTTFRKRAKTKGCEPDSAFYIQNESFVRGKLELDLAKDPPPDLVIEVDVISPSLNKLPIYAALGIEEVWLFKGKTIKFLKLTGEKYVEIESSIALPMLTSEKATEFLNKGLTDSYTKWIKEVREWAKS